MFPLCRRCAEDCDNMKECTHENKEDRDLVYTRVNIKLFVALESGYRLLDVNEVLHFPETTQYDKATGTGEFFAKYIDVFFKIKQESSGYPAWCKTDKNKEKFKSGYHQVEGILLQH